VTLEELLDSSRRLHARLDDIVALINDLECAPPVPRSPHRFIDGVWLDMTPSEHAPRARRLEAGGYMIQIEEVIGTPDREPRDWRFDVFSFSDSFRRMVASGHATGEADAKLFAMAIARAWHRKA
jgi:hypothetical protein